MTSEIQKEQQLSLRMPIVLLLYTEVSHTASAV